MKSQRKDAFREKITIGEESEGGKNPSRWFSPVVFPSSQPPIEGFVCAP